MKKLLIIKTGTTFPSILKAHGDFEDFIMNQIEISPKDVHVSSVYKNESLPDLNQVSAIMITGSHSMVTDYENWSVHLSQWLTQLLYQPIPVLGICYGHQLLAQTFGGKADYNPKGIEIGTASIALTEAGEKDSLLGVLPKTFLGHVVHSQSATMLPNHGQVLAQNEMDHHHSFFINKNIWGVQFHPEFNVDIMHSYIHQQEGFLTKKGYNLEKVYASVKEHGYGKLLLQRFMELT
ncbi:glutamine amidotransferase class-I [Alkaliphilus metalliredigens QYMF]|uniref:Glutamine amidotransferase class-I n=1 Tax=Alkaliphilus metalliredigens (strain QYMF) TaxID=293826 RepID=A6TKG4_ALKMQ|nr:glutamine amidotransferase [Alkaliphilus metalliredigens]ABR46682.1 glutamine amidotransferase class-I [Alkaliphilus metalliredigens QYMF]